MTSEFKKIGILYNVRHSHSQQLLEQITSIVKKYGAEVHYQQLDPYKCVYFKEFDFMPDLNIIIGGDGTFLSASRCFAPQGVPLLGINSGSLGFLSQLCAEYLEESLDKLFNNQYRIEERIMLKAVDDPKNPSEHYCGLNDITIKRDSLDSPLILSVYIEDFHLNDFLGDGLIIATPTGSTAYNLSVGGPIITPGLNAITLSPIASHSLSIRPLVISDNKIVRIKIISKTENAYLIADGQENKTLTEGQNVYVMKSEHKARLVLLGKEEDCFFSILRSKLHWGIIPGTCLPVICDSKE